MTGQATERGQNLALVGRVHHVGDGVVFHRMTQAEAQGQDDDFVLLVVVVGEPDRAVEDGEQMVGVVALWHGVGTVTLEAECIALGAQQVIVVAAVRRVACGAALDKCRLMVDCLLAQIVNVGVASEADAD